MIRKDPLLLHLFLPTHEHSWAVASLNPSLGMKAPVKNTLFEHAKLETRVRQVSLSQDTETASNDEETDKYAQVTSEYSSISCDCTENDSFVLLDTILRYFDSAVSRFIYNDFHFRLLTSDQTLV